MPLSGHTAAAGVPHRNPSPATVEEAITAAQAGSPDWPPAESVLRELKVNPALLTYTAYNKTKVYGNANPQLTFTLTGLVNGEYDHIPEQCFYMCGAIEEVLENYEKLQAEG